MRLGKQKLGAEDYFLLGRELLSQGQVGLGLISLDVARDVEPDHAETLDALSKYWADGQKLSEGAEAAERLAKIPGWEVRGEVRLARLRADLAEPARAAELLGDALARDPALAGCDLDRRAAD